MIKLRKNKNKFCSRLDFYSKIKKALKVFDNIEYSVITGSFVQNDKKVNDIDIVTVLPSVSQENSKQVCFFAKKHVSNQIKNGFTPDLIFPTDVVSKQQIADAIQGRSFCVIDQKIFLKKYSNDEIINNPEADYRIWLYEMITHDFDIVAGNFEALVCDTILALKTTFLWACYLYRYKKIISMEKLREDVFFAAELSNKLSEKQSRHLLIMMGIFNLGKIKEDGLVHLNTNRINKEIIKFKKSIINADFKKAKHVIAWDTIRRAVKKCSYV